MTNNRTKKQNQKGFSPIFIVILIAVILLTSFGAGMVYHDYRETFTKTNPSVSKDKTAETFCNSPQYLSDILSKSQEIIINKQNLEPKRSSTKYITWNRSENQPRVSYETKGFTLFFGMGTRTTDEAGKIIEQFITPELKSRGFNIDPLNTYNYNFEKDYNYTKHRIAYRSENKIIIVKYERGRDFDINSNHPAFFTQDVSASIECGDTPHERNAQLYDEIISIIKSVYPKLEKADSLRIRDNIHDLFYEVGVENRKGSGYEPYGLLRKNGKLEVLWQGWFVDSKGVASDIPPCALLEENGAPEGIQCADPYLGNNQHYRESKNN
jgi:hypothetical protein